MLSFDINAEDKETIELIERNLGRYGILHNRVTSNGRISFEVEYTEKNALVFRICSLELNLFSERRKFREIAQQLKKIAEEIENIAYIGKVSLRNSRILHKRDVEEKID